MTLCHKTASLGTCVCVCAVLYLPILVSTYCGEVPMGPLCVVRYHMSQDLIFRDMGPICVEMPAQCFVKNITHSYFFLTSRCVFFPQCFPQFFHFSCVFQTQVLSTGVVIFVLSLVVVYWISAKADILFVSRGQSREYLFDVSLQKVHFYRLLVTVESVQGCHSCFLC